MISYTSEYLQYNPSIYNNTDEMTTYITRKTTENKYKFSQNSQHEDIMESHFFLPILTDSTSET